MKCYKCLSKPNHKFRDCISTTCECLCIQEIYTTRNEDIEEVAVSSPKFLKINNEEIKTLPDLAVEITRFNRIRKEECTPKKKDRRFSSLRKRYENYNP